MAKKKSKKGKPKVIKCKKCSWEFTIGSPEDKAHRGKEWTNVAPMPDKDGNVTITLMATWKCKECGYTIRGSAGKTKGDFAGKSRKEKIQNKIESKEDFLLSEFSKEINASIENLEKILTFMLKKGQVSGEIKGDKFVFK